MAAAQQVRQPPPRPPPPQASAPSTSGLPSTESLVLSDVKTYTDFHKLHDIAYKYVDTGLKADEKEDQQTAVSSYSQGLELLNKAMRVNPEKLSECTSKQIDEAKEMQLKINKTKQQITFRLQSLRADRDETMGYQASLDYLEATAPPSYDEAMSEPSSPPAYDDEELAALGESLMRREITNTAPANGEKLFSIEDGVQLFYITPEGYVSAPTYPAALNIVRLNNEPQTQGPRGEGPPAFLHVGEWMYPLIPGTSPSLHTNYGAYIFPDTMSQQPGYTVGVMLPDSLSAEERQQFETIIQSFTVMEQQPESYSPTVEMSQVPQTDVKTTEHARPQEEKMEEEEEEEKDTASKISKGIQNAADWLVWGVSKGAEKAGELIKKGSEAIQEKTQATTKPSRIDPKVHKGAMYTRQATHGAVKVTGYIVNKLGEATVALARQIAPHVTKTGEKILPKSMTQKSPDGRSSFDGFVKVAASGVKGFGTVYMGLEAAAKTLGKSLANETVHVVKHRYGDEAGTFTENTMYSVGNVAMTAYNANHIGVKAVAKRAAKETGKVVLEDFNNARNPCKKRVVDGDEVGSVSYTKQPPNDKTKPL